VRSSFYEDVRHCPACRIYVRYLLALDIAYCVECGRRVELFSSADMARLLKGPPPGKPGRPRRWKGLEGQEEGEATAQTA
jgi:hypothetical protein